MIRIMLVDDHPVVRAGLRALIDGQEDLSVVAEADGLDPALAAVAADRPDVVLMDLSLGERQAGGADVANRGRRSRELRQAGDDKDRAQEEPPGESGGI